MKKLINLTGRNIALKSGKILPYDNKHRTPFLEYMSESTESICDVDVSLKSVILCVNLPPPKLETIYIVDTSVAIFMGALRYDLAVVLDGEIVNFQKLI